MGEAMGFYNNVHFHASVCHKIVTSWSKPPLGNLIRVHFQE